MKQNSVYLFVALICFSVSSCEKDSIGNVISMHDDSAAPVKEWSRYDVTKHDAERYVKLHNPDKTYEMTSYVEGADTLLYVYNFSDGWVVLSGDRRVGPVIAESPTGRLDMNDEQGYVSWIRSNAENILALKEDGPEIENKSVRMWDMIAPVSMNKVPQTKAAYKKWVIREFPINQKTTWETEVPHLIQTKWGQEYPWNRSLPYVMIGFSFPYAEYERCLIGCVAVASAQILYYLHGKIGTPSIIYHDISWNLDIPYKTDKIGFVRDSPIENSPLWDEMALNDSDYSDEEINNVTNFMMDVGNRYETIYSSANQGGSGALAEKHLTVLPRFFNITCYSSEYNKTIIRDQLLNGLPVLISAEYRMNDTGTSRHSWIIDGMLTRKTRYTMMRYVEYTSNWTSFDETYTTFSEASNRYGFSDEYDIQTFIGSDDVTVESFLMNWGENGFGDDMLYSADGGWVIETIYGNSYFESDSGHLGKIYYGFKKI